MPSLSQPLITLPLSNRPRIYIYLSKRYNMNSKIEKAAANVKQFCRIIKNLTFKLNVSAILY